MKAVLGAVGGFFDMLPGWLWATLLSAMALHACGQGGTIEGLKLTVATTQTGKANTETRLANRIAAEAGGIAQEVTKARAEEQAKQVKQEELINELHAKNAIAAADLAGARQRVRNTIYGIAPGAGGTDMPKGAGLTLRTQEPAGTSLQAADRDFADRLLQFASVADEVTRERNTCAALHP